MWTTRRAVLKAAAAGGALGFLPNLNPVSAAEAKLDPALVELDSGIEPLVRLVEDTPRERLIEEVAGKIKEGASYREVLAALLLAGVRNVQPRPNVGFKFHAVLVVNSAHLASLASPDADRWLPIFWALDYFKGAQATTRRESGWRMTPVNEGKVPKASDAKRAFVDAMEKWDEEAADTAAAGLARTAGVHECFELFQRFGCRDFRDIGHKAIYVANAFRTLECIGWRHAEPVLRSLAYALLKHDGQNPAGQDLGPDRAYKRNRELAGKLRADWQDGKPDAGATRELVATLRKASDAEACAAVVETIGKGVSPRSVWDAMMAGAGELMMRQSGIVALHAVTSTNALRYAYQASADPESRKMLLLQNAAFLPSFRAAMQRGKMGDVEIDRFEPSKSADLADVFADAGRDRMGAAAKALAYLKDGRDPQALIAEARRLIFLKGTDSHDYKFSSAVLEDYHRVSPEWRDRYLASSLFYLKGTGAKDNGLVRRVREAMG